jgi:voltage-gated potassium channel
MPGRLMQHRFTALLVALALLLLATPLVHEMGIRGHGMWGLGLSTLLFTLVLAAAVPAVSRSRNETLVVVTLAAVSIMLRVIGVFVWSDLLEAGQLVTGALFLAFVIVLILKDLFAARRVSLNAISASLCTYVLLGVLWTNVFVLITRLEPGAFLAPAAPDVSLDTKVQRAEQYIEMLYFSFTTLTTLGYGDVTPATAFARMFAVTEAIVGQIILVVLVARLVGLHVAQSTEGGP